MAAAGVDLFFADPSSSVSRAVGGHSIHRACEKFTRRDRCIYVENDLWAASRQLVDSSERSPGRRQRSCQQSSQAQQFAGRRSLPPRTHSSHPFAAAHIQR